DLWGEGGACENSRGGARKGLSQSALPYRRSVPTWLKLSADDVKEQIYKLAKKGLTPSQIGVILRDSHGVAQVRFVSGNKILRILKAKGLAPDLPEDLYHLIKKAVAVRKHLERNRKVGQQKPCSSGETFAKSWCTLFVLILISHPGQGWKVSSDSHRVSYPPPCSLLQDHAGPATKLEIVSSVESYVLSMRETLL
uniref:Small ribosomal subunit protein uS15 n=1 Tax=Eptatretus burgeri TaxID=7764 RepID=A0A8C4QGN9_EPTBU